MFSRCYATINNMSHLNNLSKIISPSLWRGCSNTEVRPKIASIHIEKSTYPFGPLPATRPAPRPWPFVESNTRTISLGEQDKPNVNHIHGRANEDDVPIYGTALMASESPVVEQKPHDGDNQVTVLVDSGALGNYFDDQRISQLTSPSLYVTENTLYKNYVLSEKMLRDVRDCTAALDLNIDTPADRGDLRSELPRGGVSPSGGAAPVQPVPSSSTSLLAPTSTSVSVSAPTSAPAPRRHRKQRLDALVVMFHPAPKKAACEGEKKNKPQTPSRKR